MHNYTVFQVNKNDVQKNFFYFLFISFIIWRKFICIWIKFSDVHCLLSNGICGIYQDKETGPQACVHY